MVHARLGFPEMMVLQQCSLSLSATVQMGCVRVHHRAVPVIKLHLRPAEMQCIVATITAAMTPTYIPGKF